MIRVADDFPILDNAVINPIDTINRSDNNEEVIMAILHSVAFMRTS